MKTVSEHRFFQCCSVRATPEENLIQEEECNGGAPPKIITAHMCSNFMGYILFRSTLVFIICCGFSDNSVIYIGIQSGHVFIAIFSIESTIAQEKPNNM